MGLENKIDDLEAQMVAMGQDFDQMGLEAISTPTFTHFFRIPITVVPIGADNKR